MATVCIMYIHVYTLYSLCLGRMKDIQLYTWFRSIKNIHITRVVGEPMSNGKIKSGQEWSKMDKNR